MELAILSILALEGGEARLRVLVDECSRLAPRRSCYRGLRRLEAKGMVESRGGVARLLPRGREELERRGLQPF